ncbi:MAG TPA: hypothetical protein VKC60_17615, partial [Opitutaceae bacterium]|nr:hypothetical protein [Opitutaceae bacterium]
KHKHPHARRFLHGVLLFLHASQQRNLADLVRSPMFSELPLKIELSPLLLSRKTNSSEPDDLRGTVMMFAYNARPGTKDIDAIFRPRDAQAGTFSEPSVVSVASNRRATAFTLVD